MTDLTCDTLEDAGGRLWGTAAQIDMNHFVYRQGSWLNEGRPDPRKFWLLFQPKKAAGTPRRAWRVRLDWLYRQKAFEKGPKRVDEQHYKSQPFEQAIAVARTEGRHEYAIQFEIRKNEIEWRLFNLDYRWHFGYVAISIACAWLWIRRDFELRTGLILFAGWGAVMYLMYLIPVAWEWGWMQKLSRRGRVLALFLAFFLVVTAVFFAGGWEIRPLEYLIAGGIFSGIRLVSWLAHGAMRYMFGYLRRPLKAVLTLVLAFLIGWGGVAFANHRKMLIIDVAPVATYTLEEKGTKITRIGAQRVPGPTKFERNVHCGDTIRAALYALDVLIPLIDLRQESRCTVGRAGAPVAVPREIDPSQEQAAADDKNSAEAAAAERKRAAKARTEDELAAARATPFLPRLLATGKRLGDEISLLPESEGFWEVLKALYAIAGWFIVSLSILTFAHANRSRGDPA